MHARLPTTHTIPQIHTRATKRERDATSAPTTGIIKRKRGKKKQRKRKEEVTPPKPDHHGNRLFLAEAWLVLRGAPSPNQLSM